MNNVSLCGYIGKDPEVKTLPSGVQVASFTLATSRSYLDKEGNWHDKTEWHTVDVWGKQTEKVSEYSKGDLVSVIGSIEYSSYEKDGQKTYFTKIRAMHTSRFLKSEDKGAKKASPKTNERDHAPDVDNGDDLPF